VSVSVVLAFFAAAPAAAPAAVEPLLPMKAVLNWRSHRNGGWKDLAQREEEDDDGGGVG
jgi:hypothetical protein